MMDGRTLNELVARLRHGDAEMRREAVRVCGRTAPLPADEGLRDALIALLEDADHETRRWAIVALSNLRDEASIRAIGYALRDSAPPVRRRVCAFLIKYPYHEALVAPMIEILRDEGVDLSARDFAVMTLAGGGHHQALPDIIATLEDAPAPLHRRLIHSLMRLPSPDALMALERLRGREDVDDPTRKIIDRAMQSIREALG